MYTAVVQSAHPAPTQPIEPPAMGKKKTTKFAPRTPSAPPPSELPSPDKPPVVNRTSVSFLYRDSSHVDATSPGPAMDEDTEEDMPAAWSLTKALRVAISRRKPLEKILNEAALGEPLLDNNPNNSMTNRMSRPSNMDDNDKLTLIDLLAIGIGGTIGSGVFVLTGDVQPVAGPSAVMSWLIAGGTCLLSAYSYMELSARIPTRGSCYIFCYATLGELAAVIGGVCLTLEYGISGAGIARSWSDKFSSLVKHNLDLQYGSTSEMSVDFFAAFLQIACISVCLCKLELGKKVILVLTLLKVILVLFLILAGVIPALTNPGEYPNLFENYDTFFPEGVGGTITGSSLLFFGFIGFDEVCCMAARSENPSKTMPRAIAGTLIGAAVLSASAQLALSYLVDFNGNLDDDGEGGTNFEDAFDEKGWIAAKYIAAVGEVALLPLVVLVSFMPQPELLAAMSEDNLIPSVFHEEDSNGVFRKGGLIAGAVLVLITFAVPFEVLWDVISLGVILSFNLTNSSLIMLRCGNGGKKVSNKPVRNLTATLWIISVPGAYLTWLNFCDPKLNDGEVNWPLSIVGFVLLFLSCVVVFLIDRNRQTFCDITTEEDIFMAPFVPYTPGFAIFGLTDHIIFGCSIMFCVSGYILYKSMKHYSKRNRESFRYSKYGKDVEKNFGVCE
ncbi:hypothetical protein TL16_g06602 [Triparma laevis f. inornata]|uniref:Uncharacterized protein n=1 Tax=Triparma laevis f. inornata TaxID=1714386 RepID=A0A9W7ANM1_9STRA|nr:hypothetical protein TL16_g06602 [Triparma laevis f. inornata]